MPDRVIAGKYQLQREVGRGGMGSVWEAIDLTLRRRVALKLMKPEHARLDDFRQRFEQEAMALAQIRNDHIVGIHDYGIDDDESPYIVMELLTGEDLKSRLLREKRLAPAAVLALLRQIASGLTAAAAVDIVHRDLKPANVFLARDDASESVKILDFGLAWSHPLDADGTQEPHNKLVGTPAYMSPEQIRGIVPHHVGDLWSVGIITYRALTGKMPFPQRSLGELIVSICTDSHISPSSLVSDLPEGTDQFFERALAKDTSQRFQNARELVEAFGRLVRGTKTTKILIVDDEPDMAHLMKMRFRKQIRKSIYEFVFAENGQAALDELRRRPDIDVVLTDINMPVMDGLTLLSHIPEVAPFVRTVVVTAYGDMGNIRRAMNAGAFDFLVKPIDFQDLSATVEKTISYVNQHREMSASDEENRVLRKFANAAVLERIGVSGPSVALASDEVEATIAVIDGINESAPSGAEPSRATIRALNANYEVIIPEIRARDGVVDRLFGGTIMAMYTGNDHLARAIDACAAITSQMRALADVAGDSSPYASGLRMGVASGRVVSGCVGSQVCARLGHTVLGEPVNEAERLAREALPREVLVSARGRRPRGWPFMLKEADPRPHNPDSEPAHPHWVLWDRELDDDDPHATESTLGGLEGSTYTSFSRGPSVAATPPPVTSPDGQANLTHHPYRAIPAPSPTEDIADLVADQDT